MENQENPNVSPAEEPAKPDVNEMTEKQRKAREERTAREKEEAWERHKAALPQAKIDDAEQIEILRRELAERDAKTKEKSE